MLSYGLLPYILLLPYIIVSFQNRIGLHMAHTIYFHVVNRLKRTVQTSEFRLPVPSPRGTKNTHPR